jgi:hypothetical protein
MARANEAVDMASDTLAGDLLGALLQEIKLLPDIWPKIGQGEQDEIIERLRKRVTDNVRMAVGLIASDQRITVVADLKKIVFGDKTEAVFVIADRDPARLDLAECRGQACLIVVTNPGAYMGGLDDVRSEPNQGNLPGVDSGSQVIEQARRRSQRKPPPADGEIDPLH